jgi:hypothetical protein
MFFNVNAILKQSYCIANDDGGHAAALENGVNGATT